jgi:hypothetical protein
LYLPTIHPLFTASRPRASATLSRRPEVPAWPAEVGKSRSILSAVAVALFAFIGTVAVAKRAFARRDVG